MIDDEEYRQAMADNDAMGALPAPEPWIERSGPGQPSTLTATEAVRCIRAICAVELDRPFDYPFFQADYRPGEEPDMALVRLFMAERVNHGSDFYTVLVLCHG